MHRPAEARDRRLHAATIVLAGAVAATVVCGVGSAFSRWFVLAGTLSTAVAAFAALYAAYEGFDAALRREPRR